MQPDLLEAPLLYAAPWGGEPLVTRITELTQTPGLRVAYLYETPDTSTFRYRVYNMIEALRADPTQGICATWFALSEADHLFRLLPAVDVLVLARVRYNRTVGELVAKARMLGLRILFECDDLVFDVRYTPLLSATLDQDATTDEHWQEWFARLGRTQATAQICDGGITTNAFLAERLAKVVNGPVHVVPNFLNRRQEDLSRRLLATKTARGFRGDGKVTIGYFSGTPTHNLDFAVALPALIDLLDRDPDVNLRIVGFMSAFDALARFAHRIERIGLQDWLTLQVKIAEVEVNIAPLQQNEFTHCKSELKFFEAAAVGSWTCATRSFTFANAISDPRYGRLTENGDWARALSEAVALARDSSAYADRASAAAEHAYARYGWDKNTQAIADALRPATAAVAPPLARQG